MQLSPLFALRLTRFTWPVLSRPVPGVPWIAVERINALRTLRAPGGPSAPMLNFLLLLPRRTPPVTLGPITASRGIQVTEKNIPHSQVVQFKAIFLFLSR